MVSKHSENISLPKGGRMGKVVSRHLVLNHLLDSSQKKSPSGRRFEGVGSPRFSHDQLRGRERLAIERKAAAGVRSAPNLGGDRPEPMRFRDRPLCNALGQFGT